MKQRKPADPVTMPLKQNLPTGDGAPCFSKRGWLAAAWRLLLPYWVSEDRWRARGQLAIIIGIDLARTYAAVRISYWQRDYWDALAAHDIAAFWKLMGVFLVIVCFWTVCETARVWFFQAL